MGLENTIERIQDVLNEWTLIDSAGFSLPHPADYLAEELQEPESFDLEDVLKTEASLNSYRHTAYMQLQQTIERLTLNAGVRGILGSKRRISS